MDNKTLKQIISQIKKYGLVDVFKTTDNFENWISSLNTKQIDNFLNLNIEPKEVANFKSILINNDLLNCQDYSKKVEAISKLKNGEGCWHLFDKICDPVFLERESFYKDNYRVPNKNKTIEKDNKEWFATANEAQEWAKKNIGKSITRSPDGNGYIVKN